MRRIVSRPNNNDEIDAFYRQHGAALLLLAVAIVGDRSRAQDTVHQVFLSLMQNEALTRALDKKSYLFACVRNAALNENKFQARNTALDLDTAWFTPPNRDHIAEQNLRRALSALPLDQREVVVMHIWGELTFAQIANLLDISANTAASRYRYALGKLRESLQQKENSYAKS
jgi:RNA polymerase sigma factor (sigma-70 family)